MKKLYGETFEATDVGGSADMQQILWFYKGNATYFVTIQDDIWVVELFKSYSGKWTVTDCYPEEQDNKEE